MAPPEPSPILVAVAPPARQPRLGVAFRLLLAVPQLVVLLVLGVVAEIVAFLGWWGALFTGRLPEFAFTYLSGYLRWSTRVFGYLFLLTDAYPPFSFDEDLTYPVRVAVPDRQQLNRAAVFWRFILMIPANIVSSVVAYGAGTLMAVAAWVITLVNGRLPGTFYLAYVAVLRYQARCYGYAGMLTAAYPAGLYGDPDWAPYAGYAPSGGYGEPASYGIPGYVAPATPDPWRFTLTSAARVLMTTFIVLGALLDLSGNVAQQFLPSHGTVIHATLLRSPSTSQPASAGNGN